MLRYFILVLQNSLSVFILLALILALVCNGRSAAWKKWLPPAAGLGAFLALTTAVLRRATNLINREYWNVGILSVSIVAAVFFLAAVWRESRRERGDTGRRRRRPLREQGAGDGTADTATDAGGGRLTVFVFQAAAALLCASLLFYTLIDIFLYPADFVLVGESVFSTEFLFKFIGYAGGLLLAALISWGLFRASGYLRSVWPSLCRALLTAALLVNLVSQAAAILQFLYARRLIPTSRTLFAVLKQIVNYHDFFLYAVMGLTFFIPLIVWRASTRGGGSFANPAERRKSLAAARGRIRWSAVIILGYALVVLCLTAGRAYSEKEVVLSPTEPMEIIGAEIVIPAENISDGHLHRFLYTASNGVGVRFIVIKKNESSYGVGLDACDICGPTGYYERGDEVVCKLCDVVMNKSTIGFKGGCNPVPFPYAMREGKMVIQTADLENEKSRFK
ncbi:MAG: Fe-S-containing protein [Gracilibacteraceae bacterium]|jgi:uncharacterized membrane protein|nr:Fe-S-containing protein [Gracilibacteraceae bacterium]